MKIKVLYSVLLFLIFGCSMMNEPKIMPTPRVPLTFELVAKSTNSSDTCINVSGTYKITPTSYEFFAGGELLNKVESSDLLYLSLFSLGNKKGKRKENGYEYVEKGVMLINQEGNSHFKVTTKHDSKALWFEDVFHQNTGDFDCFENIIILRKRYFRGGGDGISINFKRYVDIKKLISGDLLIYEQVASSNGRSHYYHVFQLIKR